MSTIGAALGHMVKAFTITLGVLLALWAFLDPEWVGQQSDCIKMETF